MDLNTRMTTHACKVTHLQTYFTHTHVLTHFYSLTQSNALLHKCNNKFNKKTTEIY